MTLQRLQGALKIECTTPSAGDQEWNLEQSLPRRVVAPYITHVEINYDVPI
jgi:hypothetical protein